ATASSTATVFTNLGSLLRAASGGATRQAVAWHRTDTETIRPAVAAESPRSCSIGASQPKTLNDSIDCSTMNAVSCHARGQRQQPLDDDAGVRLRRSTGRLR